MPSVSDLRSEAAALDANDPLKHLRSEYHVPTIADIHRSTLSQDNNNNTSPSAVTDQDKKCTYLCGNSLGLQPKRVATRIQQYLQTWATQGVQGHWKTLGDSPLPPWLHVDDRAADLIAPIVGAEKSDVAVMQTLTANLHLLMSAFYRPDPNGRHKIILESRAFPSDHYAVLSQIRHHGLDPSTSMVTIDPSSNGDNNLLEASQIESIILAHASSASLLLLPGIQYYTGQLLDIPRLTAFARSHGIFVIWDLAHAVGNVPLSLAAWDVDAAAWCSYKYLNGGPGCIGGMFVHPRHTGLSSSPPGDAVAKATNTLPPDSSTSNRRLLGWWSDDKTHRFAMDLRFRPVPGAAGFQLSNPSVLDITSLTTSLELFAEAGGIQALREKSLKLTGFLEKCLLSSLEGEEARKLFRIVTPTDPRERGAQLSLLLSPPSPTTGKGEGEVGRLLDDTMKRLEARGVVVDERRPDVIRVAPAPLYNTFGECVDFVEAFGEALVDAHRGISSS